MNLPNRITLARILAIPAYCAMMALERPHWTAGAGVLFILLALTDCLDGYVARSRGLVTDLGKFLDPLADKVLALSAASLFVADQRISAFALILILAREMSILSLRTMAALNNRVLAADIYGKAKTASQLVALSAMHFEGILSSPWLARGADAVFWFSLAMTVFSGCNYIAKNYDVIQPKS
ncbi:MAG: CDP-diacylglycerol--glycerol-3-phosphate 3-phosphatidyltransferase [Eubacteriaceae bacterium]|jgi:CDP-diacylglycerol--glycerol-3-phosphate 3-phosphatidyltransferase|nr:CDP-diacylglycerol--glycerol-3-phosphate 3-phosphatidyltransferase [Eubacteriaceae bacterium]